MSRFGRLGRQLRSSRRLHAARKVKRFANLFLEQLEDRILLSVPPASFLSGLYHDLLQRDADASGQAHWTQALQAGNSPAEVALQIVLSSEYHGKLVDQEFSALLGRAADAQGHATFSSWLDAGATLEQVKAEIFGSPEYFSPRGVPIRVIWMACTAMCWVAASIQAGRRPLARRWMWACLGTLSLPRF